MYAENAKQSFDEFYDGSVRANMHGAKITSENITDFAVYLACGKGKFMTSKAINVCADICLS